jgi:nucleotide-binding universal stress UspA family protein
VARDPRWPIERILLILCAGSTDGGALDWALRLARPCAAAITVLAVAAPLSATREESSPMQQGLASLLVADTSLGKRLQEAARHLAVSRVKSTLRLCQAVPGQQICREMDEGDHDLLILGARSCRWELRQLGADPIYSLLSRVKQPVLLAEPTSA